MFGPLRVNVMPYRGWFQRVAENALFDLLIGHRENVMLPLMLRPGIHQKRLQVDVGVLGVIEDSPARGAVATSNSLIAIHLLEEARRFLRIDRISHRDQ